MRRRKKLLSVLAITLTAAMMLSTAVFAEETESSEDYVVTYSAEEITDIDELIALALEQKAAQPAMFSLEQDESPQLNVTQVLEVREYADGNIEKACVETVLINPRATIHSDTLTGTNSYGSVSATHKLYYTWCMITEEGVTGAYYAPVSKITTAINSKGSADSVYFRHMYNFYKDYGVYQWTDEQEVYSPTVNKVYTLSATGSPQYVPLHMGSSDAYSGCTVYVNGVEAFDIRLIVYDYNIE